MKILIIEDEASLRELIERELRGEGYVVESASDYISAETKIAGYNYDCILLDVMLPGGSGLDLLELLRGMGRRENVIIISARDSVDEELLSVENTSSYSVALRHAIVGFAATCLPAGRSFRGS